MRHFIIGYAFLILLGTIIAALPARATAQPAAEQPPTTETTTAVEEGVEAEAEAEKSLYKPVPSYSNITDAAFAEATRSFTNKPNNDDFLAFSMRIPRDWEQVKVEDGADGLSAGANIFGEVARFYAPALLDARTFFTMNFADLSQEITAENWFINYINQNSYTLQFMTVHSDTKVEGIFVQVDRDTSYIVRTIAQINGKRISVISYAVPEQRWMEERDLQERVLHSFSFANPQDRQIEARRTYAFLDLLRFDYPESWRLLAPNIVSIEIMSARIVNSTDERRSLGEIDVNIVSTELDTTLAQEVKNLQDSLTERGLVIGKMLDQTVDIKPQQHVYFSRIEVYEANNKDGTLVDHEYWVGVFIEDRYYYIITMLTPARTMDFYTWATNTEAFKSVVETIRP